MGGFNFHDYIFLFGPISAVYILFFFQLQLTFHIILHLFQAYSIVVRCFTVYVLLNQEGASGLRNRSDLCWV